MLEVSDNAQLSSGVVLEIVVGDYVLTVCYAAPLWSLDRGVRMHASRVKNSHENVKNLCIIILKFTKVQLEVIIVLWGKINVP